MTPTTPAARRALNDSPQRDPDPPSVEGASKDDGGTRLFNEFGHYKLVKELGRGAQGTVYLAEDSLLHRKVALKMIPGTGLQSEEVRARFHREAEVTSKLEHSGICGIYEIGEDHGIPFIAMQYVRGTTLAELLEQSASEAEGTPSSAPQTSVQSITSLTGKHGVRDALLVMEGTARALHVAHEAGLVHRDTKPGNIMITPEGEPVLLDFGLARDAGEQSQTLTETGQVLGTPAYGPHSWRAWSGIRA